MYELTLKSSYHILLERKCVRGDVNVGDNVKKPMPYTILNVAAYACTASRTHFLSKSIYSIVYPIGEKICPRGRKHKRQYYNAYDTF